MAQSTESISPLINKKETYKSKGYVSLVVLNITLSSFYFGYCVAYFGQLKIEAVLEILDFQIDSSLAKSLLNGCIPVGGLFGALSSSIILRKLSRKNSILFLNAIALVAGGFIYIENFYSLLFFRLIQGYVVGASSAVAPLYVMEFSPKEISGTMGSYIQLLVCFGCFFSCFFAYILQKITGDPTGKQFWFILYGFPELTILLQSVVLLFVFPYQTPKYLLETGQEAEARKLIEIIYKEEYVLQILEEKKSNLSSVETRRDVVQVQSLISQDDLSRPQTNKIPIIIAIHIAALQQISGINAFVIYGGDIASKVFTGELPLLMSSILNFEQVLGTFATGFLLVKYGRKTILQFGTLMAGISNALLFIGFLISKTFDNPDVGQIFILMGLFLYMAVFGISLGPIVWLYIPQIVQPRVVPFSTASNWVVCSLVIILFPIMTQNVLNDDPTLIFGVFGAWCLTSFVFHIKLVIETKDKSQKLIQEQYNHLKIC